MFAKRLAWAVALLLLAAVALLGASGYLIRSLLLGSGKDWILSALSARAGVPIQVASVDFDIPGWYRLRPAVDLAEVRVGNPPGFTSEYLLQARRLRLRLALRPLIESRSIQVDSLEIDAPHLDIERNKEGISNFEKFTQAVSGPAETQTGAARPSPALAIDHLAVTAGEVRYPGGSITGMELELRGFIPGQPCDARLDAASPGAKIHFEGNLGPFAAGTLPIDGGLSATIALAAIPEATRRREFGELLAAPGNTATVAVRAQLKGDLYGALNGPARLTLRDILAGRDNAPKLRLDGEAPLQVSIRKALSTPLYDLRIRNGALRLGSGEWKGNLDLLLIGGVVRAKSTGSITGVEMNQFLSAFTRASGKLHGVFAMPQYTLRFGGNGAAAIRRSLTGAATLSIDKGRLRALDLVAAIRAAVEQGKAGPGSRKGDTEFTTLQAEVSAANETLRFPAIAIDGPAINASGAGSITFAQAMDFQLSALVSGPVAALLQAKAPPGTPAQVRLPLKVTGTVDQPRVYPDLGSLVRDTGVGIAEKALRDQLKRLKIPFP